MSSRVTSKDETPTSAEVQNDAIGIRSKERGLETFSVLIDALPKFYPYMGHKLARNEGGMEEEAWLLQNSSNSWYKRDLEGYT